MSPGRRTGDANAGQFYAAAVYGSIIGAAFLAAFRQEDESPESTLFALLGTLAVFWIAHVWSTIVGERVHFGRDFDWSRARRIGRSEWPLVESAFLPAVPLLLGWVGVLSRDQALNAAGALCLIQLFGWGLAVGRSTYDRWWQALLIGLVDTALGIAVILLELAFVHH